MAKESRFGVGSGSILPGCEGTEMEPRPINLELRFPAAVNRSAVNALYAARVIHVSSAVVLVLGGCRHAEVLAAIVEAVAIPVVHLDPSDA
jgi:hypothetical protein